MGLKIYRATDRRQFATYINKCKEPHFPPIIPFLEIYHIYMCVRIYIYTHTHRVKSSWLFALTED